MESGPETVRGESADQTVVVADAAPTQAAELAWSQDEDVDQVPASWGLAWSTAAVLLVVGFVAALVVGAVAWVSLSDDSFSNETAAPWFPAPPTSTEADPFSVDQRFVEAVQAHRIPMRDPAGAVATAGMVCGWLRAGRSSADAVQDLAQLNPDKTETDLAEFVELAVKFYCPQFRDR